MNTANRLRDFASRGWFLAEDVSATADSVPNLLTVAADEIEHLQSRNAEVIRANGEIALRLVDSEAEAERLRDFIEHVSVTVHAPEESYTDKQRIDDLERAFEEYGINDLMWKWSETAKDDQ